MEMWIVIGSQIECFGIKMLLFKGVVFDKIFIFFENVFRFFLFVLSMYLYCGQVGNMYCYN